MYFKLRTQGLTMKSNAGFTLIEIAIVLLIVTILLGYTVAMAPRQQELKQYKHAKQEMTEITEALYSFAQVNGYLPCPAFDDGVTTSNGFECRTNGATCNGTDPATHTCGSWFGFVPAKTLGIDGKYSNAPVAGVYAGQGLLLDPWGEPYRYHVTDSDCEELGGSAATCTAADGDGLEDFVISNEMDLTIMPDLTPDLAVCNLDPTNATAGIDTDCTNAVSRIINTSPAVILTRGKRNNSETAWAELENLDNSANDRVFVSASFSDNFDDLVKWISPNILYSKMIESGVMQ